MLFWLQESAFEHTKIYSSALTLCLGCLAGICLTNPTLLVPYITRFRDLPHSGLVRKTPSAGQNRFSHNNWNTCFHRPLEFSSIPFYLGWDFWPQMKRCLQKTWQAARRCSVRLGNVVKSSKKWAQIKPNTLPDTHWVLYWSCVYLIDSSFWLLPTLGSANS